MPGSAVNRRTFVRLAGASALTSFAGRGRAAVESLFDGKTVEGWLQIENDATTLSSSGITDPVAFVRKLVTGTDAISAFLRGQMPDTLKADLAAYSPRAENAKAVISALVKYLNQVLARPSIHERAGYAQAGDAQGGAKIALRPETERLLRRNPQGQRSARLNKLVLEDAYPSELAKSVETGWIVKDGAMASTGSGRGIIYTARDFSRFRLMFTMRHVSGDPDHQTCVLIFCTRPPRDEKPLDALGGIQFQVPNGGHWDYRPGMNNNGGAEFTQPAKGHFDVHAWSRVEIVADAATGSARMAVAQPPGARAVELLDFHDPAAGKSGPIAWQMHNAGLFDEYKDVSIEVDPKDESPITAR